MFVTADKLVGENSKVADAKTGVDDKTMLDTNIIDKQLAVFDDWKEEMEEWNIVINEATARFAKELAIIDHWSSNIDDWRNLTNNFSNVTAGRFSVANDKIIDLCEEAVDFTLTIAQHAANIKDL